MYVWVPCIFEKPIHEPIERRSRKVRFSPRQTSAFWMCTQARGVQDLEHTFVHFHGCFRSNNNHRDADAENRETDLAVWRVCVREWICALLGISPSLSDCLISPCVCACGDGPCWEHLAMHICVTAAQENVWRSDDTRRAFCWQASGTYSLCFSTIYVSCVDTHTLLHTFLQPDHQLDPSFASYCTKKLIVTVNMCHRVPL